MAQKGLEWSAVCRRLVKAQGGTVTVKSEVGEGSAFRVQIPAREKPEVK
jgi:signal transduction histidine kinase